MTICYRCGYSWSYNGKSLFYITCPKCMNKLSLKRINEAKL